MPKYTRKSKHLIQSLEAKELKKRSLTLKLADDLTSFFGSLTFLFINLVVFAAWILTNTQMVTIPGIPVFDPYPFVLLITAVSLEAIVLATVVLISQNREGYINTLRDELMLQVDLVTERELTKALRLLKMLLEENKVEIKDEELEDMLKEVDTTYIERRLQAQLSQKKEPLTKRVGKTFTPKKKNRK